MELSPRQKQILELAKAGGPITGEELASHLNVTRAALRPDLAILTMSGLLTARPRVGYTYSGRSSSFFAAERLRQTKVREIYALPVVVNENLAVYDAIVSMFLEDVGTLFVVDGQGWLTGVVSRSDLLKHSMGNLALDKVPVGVVMTRLANIVHVTMDDTALQAARKLINHRVSTLPVVRAAEAEGKLEVIGAVSLRTITGLFVEIGIGHE
ncbi:MAG: helix-turn-helix transcriptional regulator [Bacillota bacterium]